MPEQDHLESFIGNSFRSVWALEVLQFLVEHTEASFSPEELISALRVSDAVISQSVENLSAAGLTVVDGEGRISLRAAKEGDLRLVREAIDFYQKAAEGLMGTLFPTLVYALCFATSALCAFLLGRGYLRNRSRMLLWSTICFTLLAVVNLLVVFDLVIYPTSLDLRPERMWLTLAAVAVLLFGFIWREEL